MDQIFLEFSIIKLTKFNLVKMKMLEFKFLEVKSKTTIINGVLFIEKVS